MIYTNYKDYISNLTKSHVNYLYSNNASVDLARNLACSAKQHDYGVVFFSMDIQSTQKMRDLCDVVELYKNYQYELQFANNYRPGNMLYGTNEFNSTCWIAWDIAVKLLRAGISITYLDTDIIVKQNIQPTIHEELMKSDKDITIQTNHIDGPCAGFFSIHSSKYKKIQSIYNENNLSKLDYNTMDDQDFLKNKIVPDSLLQINYLCKDLYPNGHWYRENHGTIDTKCKIIHFNCNIGIEQKIKEIKHYGYYYEKN